MIARFLKNLLVPLLMISYGLLLAQTDSTKLIPEQLNAQDIFFIEEEEEQPPVISISGKDQLLFGSPQSVYIITKEEIRQNGYSTLADVLRMVPGMLVSPYGSAREGELFMLHGTRGNRMADVMINGVSIKPILSAGMPLGTTLPIRQAERIEVYTAPGGVNFLFGANGGVVNIVLKDSERPVTTQADLTIGENRYNNIDVLFGGKIGRGKRIIKFTAWGGATNFDDWDTGIPSTQPGVPSDILGAIYLSGVYDKYYSDQRFFESANYLGESSIAEKDRFPHQSRHLGLSLQYNKLELVFDYRYRRDHSALGLNPLTVSYNNPNNYFAETTTRLHVKRKMGNKRFRGSFDASAMIHVLDPASSFQPIQSHVGHAYEINALNQLEVIGVSITDEVRDSIYNLNQANHFTGDKYRSGFVFQGTFINTYSLKINKHYNISFGPGIVLSAGLGEFSYLDEPYEATQDALLPTNLLLERTDYFNMGRFDAADGGAFLFFNNELSWEKWKANFGLKYSLNTAGEFWTPRINVNYKPFPNLSFRADYWLDQWLINDFYLKNTFFFGRSIDRQRPRFFIYDLYPMTETRSLELGIRWGFGKQNNSIDLLGFVKNSENVLNFETRSKQPFGINGDVYATGYFSDGGVSQRIIGVQTQMQLTNLFGLRKLNSRIGMMISSGFKSAFTGINSDLSRIPDYPSTIAQWRLSYAPGNWYLAVENIFHNRTISAAHTEGVTSAKVNTDLILRYQLSRNFELSFKTMNLFNVRYFGISAEENIDALYFNIQPYRRNRLGVTYRLD